MKNNNIEKVLANIGNSIKDEYELEYFHFHKYRYRYILNKVSRLPLSKHARVLDVGCYPLHLFAAFRQLGCSVYGISSPHEPIKAANIAVLNIETNPLPFKDSFFELIIFSEIMEHLVVNPLIYLVKLKRVLAPGGTLLLTTPNAAGLHKLVPILMGHSTYFPLSELFATRFEDGSLYHRHNREYTLDEMVHILEKAGYSIKARTHFEAFRSYQHKSAAGRLNKQLMRLITFWLTILFKRLRDSLYVEATYKSNVSLF